MAEQVLLGSLEAGGTKMVCATGYADGTIVERGRFDTTTPEETVRACADWFAERGVAALGVGAFGPTAVDPASPRYGQILTTPKLAWRDFDLLGTLKSRFDIPMGYDTDVNIACLGEVTFGCARGLEDVLYLTIGTGVGAGVMVGGKLIHGFHANCLEGLIAGPGVAKRWGGVRASELATDDFAMDLLGGYLGQALMDFILCYAPKKIIIGGGVADHTPIVQVARKKVAEYLNNYLVTPEMDDLDNYIVNNSLEGALRGVSRRWNIAPPCGGRGGADAKTVLTIAGRMIVRTVFP